MDTVYLPGINEKKREKKFRGLREIQAEFADGVVQSVDNNPDFAKDNRYPFLQPSGL